MAFVSSAVEVSSHCRIACGKIGLGDAPSAILVQNCAQNHVATSKRPQLFSTLLPRFSVSFPALTFEYASRPRTFSSAPVCRADDNLDSSGLPPELLAALKSGRPIDPELWKKVNESKEDPVGHEDPDHVEKTAKVNLIQEIDDSTFDDEVIHSKKPVLVDFYRENCQVCRVFLRSLKIAAGPYDGVVKFVKLNVTHNPKVAARYKVRNVPRFVLFKEGKDLFSHEGRMLSTDISNLIQEKLEASPAA